MDNPGDFVYMLQKFRRCADDVIYSL
jgi:hypothetical protein